MIFADRQQLKGYIVLCDQTEKEYYFKCQNILILKQYSENDDNEETQEYY